MDWAFTHRHKLLSSFHKGCILSIWNITMSLFISSKLDTQKVKILGLNSHISNLTKVPVCKNIFKKKNHCRRHSLFECALFKPILSYSIKNIVIYKWNIKPLNFIYFAVSVYLIEIWLFFNFLVLINKNWWHIINIVDQQVPLNKTCWIN